MVFSVRGAHLAVAGCSQSKLKDPAAGAVGAAGHCVAEMNATSRAALIVFRDRRIQKYLTLQITGRKRSAVEFAIRVNLFF